MSRRRRRRASRRGRCRRRRRGGGGRGGRLTAKNLEHHHATGRTLAFDGFAPVLHQFFDGVSNFFLRFALNTISFWHKNPDLTPVRLRNFLIAYGPTISSVNVKTAIGSSQSSEMEPVDREIDGICLARASDPLDELNSAPIGRCQHFNRTVAGGRFSGFFP